MILLRCLLLPRRVGEFIPRTSFRSYLRALSTSVERPQDSNATLRRIFDDHKYFKDFNKKNNNGNKDSYAFSSIFSTNSTGLFRNEMLSSPDSLVDFSKKSLADAKNLVNGMLNDVSESEHGKVSYIRKLDQLSDILCRVIDVAEFIRVVHPSQSWIDAAQRTHELMFEYMNELNTNVELYDILYDILLDKNIVQKLTAEEVLVGEYLKQDFERSGIHMAPEIRQNFVALTQSISLLGSDFNNGVNLLGDMWCKLTKQEFKSIPSNRLKKEILSFQSKSPEKHDGYISVPLTGHIPYAILTTSPSEEARRKIWTAIHNSSPDQIQTLNSIIQYRAILAKMLGYKSFSHYQLEHKMAKSPENVMTFLKNLQQTLRKGSVLSELKNLYKLKEGYNPNLSDEEIISEVKPWDRDYLSEKLQSLKCTEPIEDISPYLSVGTIMAGLARLFENLYNITFIPEPTVKGETWDENQVRKLNVFDLNMNKTLGYIYLDFWSPKVLPSHFTIVCLRKLNTDLGYEAVDEMRTLVQLNEEEDHQLPVISIICNFSKHNDSSFARLPGSQGEPTLLSLDQVDTIFHEMGHAMHSMIGKTDLHNLSGTRCLTDFVELPSVLMEYFSKDPRVLCEIGRHYSTNEPLSELLLDLCQQKRARLDHCETFMQSKMAMLDQALNGEEIIDIIARNPKTFDSTPVYHSLESKLKVFCDNSSTWHGKFPHLFSYGAVYYSYLLDRAIASIVWKRLFEKDPWRRDAGEKYKNGLLKWGGTRDPWTCLSDTLDDKELRGDATRAMEVIGQRSSV
ncbi:uncharacterized protein PRCAT00001028001 [Priceomyces carsonii]|uniref:uncharacterized protein n=1 Tax=Priceomyces carsonii TaxID=28549 RepID=UPI002EDAAB18|nr:unnamed protein product [Priceomyces carsonii]